MMTTLRTSAAAILPTLLLISTAPAAFAQAPAALAQVPAALAQVPAIIAQAPGRDGGNAARTRGILLEDLTWMEARDILDTATIIVIPLGAAAKEHGPHLKLKNDWTMAEYLKRRVLEGADVVIAPTVNYHFYPAFVEYPGSTTLRAETARDVIVDIVRSLARHGPRRFYVLNTGVSTLRPLQAAREELAADGILLHYTDILRIAEPVEREVSQQQEGTHADEIETSIMLYIDPASVDMSRAATEYPTAREGRLTPDPNAPGRYSPTGIYGDATLATREKGERIVEAMVAEILREIEALRRVTP